MNKDPILAAILSVVIPGLGQFYCREWARGAMFLTGTFFVALLFPPIGPLLSFGAWIWSAVDAYRVARGARSYDPTGSVIEIGRRLRLPRIDFRPALPYIGIPLAIVAVLVIVGALALIRYGLQDGGPHQTNLKLLTERIENYRIRTGSYPSSLEDVIDRLDPMEKRQTLDQWGNEYIYGPAPNGFELWSAGKDSQPGTADDIRLYPSGLPGAETL